MTIKDKQLLRDALDFARRSAAGEEILVNGMKSEWNQSTYSSFKPVEDGSCRTAFCIAGYIVAQHPDYRAEIRTYGDDKRIPYLLTETVGGESIAFHELISAQMLGVETPTEEDYQDNLWDGEDGGYPEFYKLLNLFDGMNDLEDVERIAAELLDE